MYEYKWLEIENTSESDLNKLGLAGWRLVAANDYYLFFERGIVQITTTGEKEYIYREIPHTKE